MWALKILLLSLVLFFCLPLLHGEQSPLSYGEMQSLTLEQAKTLLMDYSLHCQAYQTVIKNSQKKIENLNLIMDALETLLESTNDNDSNFINQLKDIYNKFEKDLTEQEATLNQQREDLAKSQTDLDELRKYCNRLESEKGWLTAGLIAAGIVTIGAVVYAIAK